MAWASLLLTKSLGDVADLQESIGINLRGTHSLRHSMRCCEAHVGQRHFFFRENGTKVNLFPNQSDCGPGQRESRTAA